MSVQQETGWPREEYRCWFELKLNRSRRSAWVKRISSWTVFGQRFLCLVFCEGEPKHALLAAEWFQCRTSITSFLRGHNGSFHNKNGTHPTSPELPQQAIGPILVGLHSSVCNGDNSRTAVTSGPGRKRLQIHFLSRSAANVRSLHGCQRYVILPAAVRCGARSSDRRCKVSHLPVCPSHPWMGPVMKLQLFGKGTIYSNVDGDKTAQMSNLWLSIPSVGPRRVPVEINW